MAGTSTTASVKSQVCQVMSKNKSALSLYEEGFSLESGCQNLLESTATPSAALQSWLPAETWPWTTAPVSHTDGSRVVS